MRETDESFKKASEAMDLAVMEYSRKSNEAMNKFKIVTGNDLIIEAKRRNGIIRDKSIEAKEIIGRSWTSEM